MTIVHTSIAESGTYTGHKYSGLHLRERVRTALTLVANAEAATQDNTNGGLGAFHDGELLDQHKKAVAPTWECEDEKLHDQQTRSVFGPGVVLKSAYSLREAICHLGQDGIKKQGVLQKRVIGKTAEWRDRFITLTKQNLYIRNEMGGDIKDSFSLLDITHVKKMFSLESSPSEERLENPSAQGRVARRTSIQSSKSSRGAPDRSGSRTNISDISGEGRVDSFANGEQNVTNLCREQKILHSEWENVLQMYAERYGRTYYLRAASIQEAEVWRLRANLVVKRAGMHQQLSCRGS